MRDAPQASPRECFRQLQLGYQRYLELIRGGTSTGILQHDEPRETEEFYRPKIAVIQMTPHAIPSPRLMFDQVDHRIVEYRFNPGEGENRDAAVEKLVNQVEWAFQCNRLQLIVLLAGFSVPKTKWYRRVIDRRYLDFVGAREVLPELAKLKSALELKSAPIREAVEQGRVALVEALYDPSEQELYLDLARVMEGGVKNV